MNPDPLDPKYKIEDYYQASDNELGLVGDCYTDFYRWRTFRSGAFRQFNDNSMEDVWRISRELFWNYSSTKSEDLNDIGLAFNIPFTRKEVMDFASRMVSLGIKPRIIGDGLDSYGVKILQSMYQRWRFKNNDRVEKFWQLMYGVINGTVCLYVGYNNRKKTQEFLKSYDAKSGAFTMDTKEKEYWGDVEVTLVPIEDIYLSKIYEKNIQKQGKLIRKTQMDEADFHTEFQMYPDHKFVRAGNRIAEDSLYFRLLGGTGVTTTNKVEVLRLYDTDNDQFCILANGILLNKLGSGKSIRTMPMPFDHKMMPFVWSIGEAVDEKLAYGLPMPYKTRDMHKMANAQFTMLLERELRLIDPPILTSDIEAPDIIFGQKKIIPVTDVEAYKEIDIKPASGDYFTSLNSVQQLMSTIAQGGVNQVIPSIQPKSAAEVDSANQAKQQAMGVPLLMYYDMIRQEAMLILRTMLQFYTAEKFSKDGANITRALTVPNMPLTLGGVGDVEIRFVDKTSNPLELYFESIRKATQNGRMTEIIEAPIDLIQKLEFEITDVELEPEQTSEMKKAMFVQSVIQPMLQSYVQMGIADPAKVFLRHLEALGEHPADYVSNNVLPQMMASWGSGYPVPGLVPKQQQQQQQGQPQAGGMQGAPGGTPMQAMQQSIQGQANGGASNGGQGATPFTSPQMPPSMK